MEKAKIRGELIFTITNPSGSKRVIRTNNTITNAALANWLARGSHDVIPVLATAGQPIANTDLGGNIANIWKTYNLHFINSEPAVFEVYSSPIDIAPETQWIDAPVYTAEDPQENDPSDITELDETTLRSPNAQNIPTTDRDGHIANIPLEVVKSYFDPATLEFSMDWTLDAGVLAKPFTLVSAAIQGRTALRANWENRPSTWDWAFHPCFALEYAEDTTYLWRIRKSSPHRLYRFDVGRGSDSPASGQGLIADMSVPPVETALGALQQSLILWAKPSDSSSETPQAVRYKATVTAVLVDAYNNETPAPPFSELKNSAELRNSLRLRATILFSSDPHDPAGGTVETCSFTLDYAGEYPSEPEYDLQFVNGVNKEIDAVFVSNPKEKCFEMFLTIGGARAILNVPDEPTEDANGVPIIPPPATHPVELWKYAVAHIKFDSGSGINGGNATASAIDYLCLPVAVGIVEKAENCPTSGMAFFDFSHNRYYLPTPMRDRGDISNHIPNPSYDSGEFYYYYGSIITFIPTADDPEIQTIGEVECCCFRRIVNNAAVTAIDQPILVEEAKILLGGTFAENSYPYLPGNKVRFTPYIYSPKGIVQIIADMTHGVIPLGRLSDPSNATEQPSFVTAYLESIGYFPRVSYTLVISGANLPEPVQLNPEDTLDVTYRYKII